MKISVKALKGMVSVILATVMATSCVVGPVGAFKAPKESSQEFIDRVAALNLKVDNYKNLLKEADQKLPRFSEWSGRNLKAEKIVRYMYNSLKHLMERQYYSNPNKKCLDDLKNGLIVYDENYIDQISAMLDDFESDINLLVNKIDGLSVDIDNDKVFYTEKSGIISLDENEDNGNKKELKYTQMKKFFGDAADRLTNKIGEVYKLTVDGMNEKLKDDIQDVPVEDTMILMNLNKKLEEYEAVRSDYADVKQLLRVNGRCPKDLKIAIRALTGDNDYTRISTSRNSEFIKNAESMQNAIVLIDNAIDQMKKFMASKIAKNKEIEIKNISSIMNGCIDAMVKQEHINKSEKWASSEEFKKSNERFTGAFLKLKSLAELTDDAGKQLLREFRDMYAELLDLYVFYDANKAPDVFSAEVQVKAQQVRGKLSEILEKCKEIQQ